MTCTLYKYTGENRPTKEKDSQNRNFDAAFATVFGNSKCFQKNKLNFIFIVLFQKAAYMQLKRQESTDLI
jgi:hypothetical protein